MNLFFGNKIAKCIKALVLLVYISSVVEPISAKTVNGYIISNLQDTVYGSIKLSKFDLIRNTVSVNSYNFDDLFNQVFFKAANEKKFKNYSSGEIQEFSFILNNCEYRFISREVKTLWRNSNKKYFYLQIEMGAINLFESRIIQYDSDKRKHPFGLTFTDYYLLGEDKNLINVQRTIKNQTIFNFLSTNLKLDTSILTKVIGDKSFNDIVPIVQLYNSYSQ